jgi:DNA-binding transcriptional regulator YdaS (Cro superfamily)
MTSREAKRAEAALALAISRIGGASALARELKISKAAVSQWIVCPIARVSDVESICGIDRSDLRPDYYQESK